MLKNYFTIAWRNVQRNSGYTILNIAGLAFGLAAFIVALVYVNYETGFDKWHKQLERVYRIDVAQSWGADKAERTMWSPPPLAPKLMANCPEIEAIVRIRDQHEGLISANDKQIYTNKVISADSALLTVFPYKMVYGSATSALVGPDKVIINLETSHKLFGDVDPVGKTLTYNAGNVYSITGVFEPTGPSHLEFNVCMSNSRSSANWNAGVFFTYALLKPGTSTAALSQRAKNILVSETAAYNYGMAAPNDPKLAAPGSNPSEWLKKNGGRSIEEVYFEAVQGIHLDPRAGSYSDSPENHPLLNTKTGNGTPVTFFAIAAVMVLLLACINYTNLSIARAGKRAKEAGMRKVMGAGRRQLTMQFLAEAFIQCLVAMLIALLLSRLVIFLINSSFSMQLSFIDRLLPMRNLLFAAQLFGILLVVTMISGAYPAFVLSSFRPVKVLKGEITKNVKGRLLRNSLVVLQFGISACFVIGMVVVYKQLNYMNTKDPGFNTQQIMVLHPHDYALTDAYKPGQKIDLIKSQLMQIPGVKATSVTDIYPGTPSNVQGAEATSNNRTIGMGFSYIHFDYFKVLGMKMLSGRDFDASRVTDTVSAIVINQTAAKLMGYKDPIGQKFTVMNRDYNVIGVVNDNHIAGYNAKIGPESYAVAVEKGMFGNYQAILVKIDGRNAANTAAAIESYWKTIEPNYPLRYSWLDQEFAKLLDKYERFGKITIMLSSVSIVIALMGIFALSAFAAAQRTKEIGIRKVFGASVAGITAMLSVDFLKLILVALLVAFPIAYWGASKWLQDFAYRIDAGWLIFAISGLGIMLIALLTVSYQAMKAAIVNPIKSLRTE
ncbi:ABC transporter permease [Mucilaginibacter myungsuensis]|uniref:ABC transporter permease n=1 Tax=Mucilaginibacter myungsuensis TaxID=649104 RepID=A0A929L2U8_9SPHI|nr:ABC transporter permease [Mucilaginibacter myungsuensis]MBE9664628.1 ABC transporter permease [Mucilaginibacter myungsuensis]MDN3601482.1 ABC transporter permease [Mucilaginibacter myungsuensis]